jgi:hypothetical protein
MFGGMKDLRIQYKNTDSLVPYVRNAKDHPQHQIDELVSLIKQFGFVNPLIIDQAHEIIAGHGRLLAAKQMGMEKVPCVIINHLTEDQRKALRLADNKVSSKSTWNWKNLSDELNALKISDFDLAFTAFEQSELDALIDSASAIIPDIEELEHAPRIPHEAVPHDPASKPPPKEVSGELTRMDSPRPKATDDEYSNFELVMLHPNKVRLVELLARIKERNGLEKVEEAMMLLVDSWED